MTGFDSLFGRHRKAPPPAEDERFLLLAEATPALVLIAEGDVIRFANRAAIRRLGAEPGSLIGGRFSGLAHPDTRPALSARMTGSMSPSALPSQRFEMRLDGPPGQESWLDVTVSSIRHEDRPALLVTGFDVTDRKLAESAMRESERRLRDLIENVQLISIMLDEKGEVTFANEYALEVLGLAEEAVLGRSWFELALPLERRETALEAFRGHLQAGSIPHEEYEILTARGDLRIVSWNSTVLHDPGGRATGMASIGSDVTERRRAEKRLLHDALHDALTQLPNRALFMDRLRTSLARLRRRPTHLFAVIFLDLDRFKVVNDSLGHMAGDQFLVQVARTLQHTVRAEHTVARFGGDEFAILLDDLDAREDARRVVERIFQFFEKPLKVAGQDLFASMSAGIAFGDAAYETAEDMLRDADTAMYQAKTTGRARFQIFDESMHRRAMGLLKLEHSLRRATENQEFVLNYQPIVGVDGLSLVGFEALVRWNHPTRGLVGPYEFIHLAEETGLIFRIGAWTLREACRWLAARDGSAPSDATINVNLSVRQFSQGDLLQSVEDVLRETGLAPSRLKLEITESVIMENPEVAVDILKRLKALGTRLCIDDFGTGYSSLSYLLRFPADTLKIDRSFVQALGRSGRNENIVGAIVSLARSLDMDVVAEGVETEEQVRVLRDLGCPFGQGYLYSRPLDGSRAAAFQIPEGGLPLHREGRLPGTDSLRNPRGV